MSGVEVKEGHRVVGSDLARHDAIEKVAGRTVYAADFALPGMLHARLKRSDYAHARLTRIDTAAAEAIDGVVAVYTAADVPRNTVWVDVPGQTLEVGALKARSNVLAEDVVLYDGEPIALRHLAVVETGDAVVRAASPSRVMTFGGAPVGRRYIWWNFVASTQERIDAAKADWAARRFAPIPGETERVELPSS